MAERVETAVGSDGSTPSFGQLVDNWRAILAQGNLPQGRSMDFVSKWLLITRACVFSMTATSALIGGLLAAATVDDPNWTAFFLATLGLILAHAANNMINDWFDTTGGVDTAQYTRALYAPHPLLSGLISKAGLLASIAVVNLLDLWILVELTEMVGWGAVAFALAGLFISVFYVAPPVKLKHHGLGEPGVFVVWGPLMIGGVYYVTAGTIPFWVIVASFPYAISVTTVLIGKHVDKYEQDASRGIRTLPVIRLRARVGREPRPRRAARRLRPAAPLDGAEGLLAAEAGRAAPGLPHLAPLVRRPRLPPQQAGGRALRAGAGGESDLRLVTAQPSPTLRT
jgi:1,4-dihydroxy-2-naphthoate octaprenyltransferase